MSLHHVCYRLPREGEQPLPPEIMTCGTCLKHWCRRCDPTPASLCPYCNGAESTVSNPVIAVGEANGTIVDDAFVERVIGNVQNGTTGWLNAQVVGTLSALRQQARDSADAAEPRAVLIRLAEEHPEVRGQIAELMPLLGLEPMRFLVRITAYVSQVWEITEEYEVEHSDEAVDRLRDALEEGEVLPSEWDLQEQTVNETDARVTTLSIC